MRFLKNKILRAQEALKRQTAKSAEMTLINNEVTIKIEETSLPDTDCSKKSRPQNTIRHHQPRPRRSPTDRNARSELSIPRSDICLKNTAINYGKAIASFAISPLALPYLHPLLSKEGIVTLSQFQQFALHAKGRIGGFCSLRSALLTEEGDNEKTSACKRIFQAIGEVFIKYFSVNWILTGRLTNKMVYMKLRANMLRKIQNPESIIDKKIKV